MSSRPTRGFRSLPSVDAVLRREELAPLLAEHGREVVAAAVREAIQGLRGAMARAGGEPGSPADERLMEAVGEAVRRRTASTLRRVINATGVVVHTNLGRALLSAEARRRVERVSGSYATLEYDLAAGARGSRSWHLERGLSAMFPGRAALAVNNNAAALFLALHTLSRGREAIVSRGELVEIGGSFRIPDVMSASGTTLREVGTTNRTRLEDYEQAIGPRTALLLKVHTSNYRIVGFTSEAGVAALAGLAAARGLPLLVDQGSGLLRRLAPGPPLEEPSVEEILAQGAGVVTFSGDKLLGGPQAGLAVGRPELIETMRRSPLYRVLRLDKMSIAALEATLDAYARGSERDELPVLGMILQDAEALRRRAEQVAGRLAPPLEGAGRVTVEPGASRVGGGAAPGEDLPSWLVAIRPPEGRGGGVAGWEAALRAGEPAVVARVQDNALLLDLRTVAGAEQDDLVAAVVSAVRDQSPDRTCRMSPSATT
ncbi:MAG TPA: L-seryl-tRNA(Sec) selenium transferase [Candidatus Polarisedimenticolia bacterium]|nr:L-seryl-tRNA(Sec) selenium transferase [Candidatus Polarisedimenticolia bacterium]